MIGMVDIFINKDASNFLLSLLHTNTIGFGQTMGDFEEVTYDDLKEAVKEGVKTSLKYYKIDVEVTAPWKDTKYKTWNKFFNKHDLIAIRYDTEEQEERKYKIFLWEKELKTHSYTTEKEENRFFLSQEEFETDFYTVFDTLRSRIEE